MENRSIHDDVWLAPWDPEWAHKFHMEKQCIVGSISRGKLLSTTIQVENHKTKMTKLPK